MRRWCREARARNLLRTRLHNVFTCYYLHTLCNNERVPENHQERLLRLVVKLGLLRTRDLQSAGIPRTYLAQLVKQGKLLKTGRGLYVHANASLTEHHSLAEAAKRVPKGVVCLLSALRFHDLTTENPAEVWLAVPRETRRPRSGVPALRVMQFSGEMMMSGIEKHTLEGVSVPIYSVAKTVADCFRFRNRTGVNVAIEALRDAWRNKKATSDELWRFARICRVLNVMRPYFDSLT